MNEYKLKVRQLGIKIDIFKPNVILVYLAVFGENGQTYQYYKSCIYMYDSWKLHVIGNNTGLVKYKLFLN